jgi:hypothetical protein
MTDIPIQFVGQTNPPPFMRNVPEHAPKQKTVLVVGQSRGGTSCVAGVLDALGVYMGPPEELRSGGSFESFVFVHGDDAARLAEVDRCNAAHDVWGWKQPFGVDVLMLVPTTVRNLHCIFVTRDAWAVAQALMKHAKSWADGAVAVASERSNRILSTAMSTTHPSLVVSYERIKSDPVAFADAVMLFLNLDATAKQVDEARARISPTGGYPQMPDTYGTPAAPPPHTTPERWGKDRL